MLRKITPDAKLLSDLSEETRSNTAIAKYTADDRGDLKLYKTSDGKRSFLRVCETIPPAAKEGPSTYEFTVFEIIAPAAPSIAPTILDAK